MKKINSDLFKKFENNEISNMNKVTGGNFDLQVTGGGNWGDGWCWTTDNVDPDCGCGSYYGTYQCPPLTKRDTIA